MTLRLMQAGLLAVLAACSATPSQPAEAASDRPFKVTEVTKFESPWAMDFLPGSGVPLIGAALVTEKSGKLWLVDIGTGKRQEVAGVPAVHVEGQGGLLDVATRLESLGRWRVYLSFAEAGPNGTSGAAVGHGQLIVGDGNPRIEGFKVMYRQRPKVGGGAHYAGRFAFSPDGHLFVSFGERFQFDPAQDLGNDLGKVLRLTAQGGIPADNPYETPGDTMNNTAMWSFGHRNPLGIAFAPDGRLWEVEMGPMGGDELNLILPKKNYGWPRASYGSHYDGRDIPDAHKSRGYEEPKLWWNPSISPGALLIYSGDLFPQWKGDALIGALSGQALIRADIDGDKARKADQWDMGARIRAVDQGPRGEVYLLEDGDSGGRLLRLEPAQVRR